MSTPLDTRMIYGTISTVRLLSVSIINSEVSSILALQPSILAAAQQNLNLQFDEFNNQS